MSFEEQLMKSLKNQLKGLNKCSQLNWKINETP